MSTDQVISILVEKIDTLSNRLARVEKENEELKKENIEIKKEIAEFKAKSAEVNLENKELRTENAELRAENAELKSRLNSNSRNSSKPPSSDGYMKPALPKKKRGKQGGQNGHKGYTLQQVENPDKIVECDPEKCGCGYEFTKD